MTMHSFKGVRYFLKGLPWLVNPSVLPFVLVPLAINILLFSILIYCGWQQFHAILTYMQDTLPTWLSWLQWLVYPLFFLTVAIVVFLTFTWVANLISSPFNGMLAEVIERKLTGKSLPDNPWHTIVTEMPMMLKGEVFKLLYYFSLVLGILVLTLIPIVNLIAPFLWFVLTAWMLALQYMDYPMGNHGFKNRAQRRILAKKRWMTMQFGGVIALVTLLPGVNLFIIPAAIAGATEMWVAEFKEFAKTS